MNAALLVAAAAQLTPALLDDRLTVVTNEVRLADIVNLSHLPDHLRQPAARLVLGHKPRNKDLVELTDRALFALAISRMPVLANWLPRAQGRVISIRFDDVRISERQIRDINSMSTLCVRLIQPLTAGAIPERAMFEPAPCISMTTGAFGYDPISQAPRARRTLAAGNVVRATPFLLSARVLEGRPLELTTIAGAIRINRKVTAMQSAVPGQRLFVRSQDGTVYSARYEGSGQ